MINIIEPQAIGKCIQLYHVKWGEQINQDSKSSGEVEEPDHCGALVVATTRGGAACLGITINGKNCGSNDTTSTLPGTLVCNINDNKGVQ